MERRVDYMIDVPVTDTLVTERERRSLTVYMVLVLMDTGLILLGFALAHWLRYDIQLGRDIFDPQSYKQLAAFYPMMLVFTGILVIMLHIKGMYSQSKSAPWFSYAAIILSSVTTAIALVIIGMFALRTAIWSRLIMVFVWISVSCVLIFARIMLRIIVRWGWKHGHWLDRIVVVGNRGLAKEVMAELQYSDQHGAMLLGYVDGPPDNRDDVAQPGQQYRWLGQFHDLATILAHQRIDQVIVALPFWAHDRLPQVVDLCRRHQVDFRVAPDLYELSFDRVNIQRLSNIPLLRLKKNVIQGGNYLLKRALDVALIGLSLPLWGSILCFGALLTKLSNPHAPVMFQQARIGRHGREFRIYKLRTMVPDAEQLKETLRVRNEAQGALFKIKDDPRVTRLGRLLRKLSIDELPQLYNVLKGDMSLVGPRPQVPDEVEQYEPWHFRRLEVLPGLTGLWQATGRSNTSFDDMVRLDIYYTEHWSFWLDLRILMLTVPAVLFGRGAY